jgi:hypothetical protein
MPVILKNLFIIIIQGLTLMLCPWVGICNLVCIYYGRADGKSTGECLAIAYFLSGLFCLFIYSSGLLYWLISMILTIVVYVVYECHTEPEAAETQNSPVSDDVAVQEEQPPVRHYYGDIHIDKAVFLQDSDFNNR